MKELIDSKYPQYSLLSESGFRRFLDSRGIYVRTENLEQFEKEGFLFPVLRLYRPKSQIPGRIYEGVSTDAYSLKSYKDGGFLEYPSFDNFREWSSYKDGYENSVVILYHPYQILIIQKLLSSVSSISKYSILESREEFRQRFDEIKPFYDKSKKYYLKTKPNRIKIVGLLLHLQNAYQPIYRNSFIPDWRGEGGTLEDWRSWKRKKFSPEETLKRSDFTIDEVKDFRDWLAVQASFIDPIKNFYMIFHLIPYRKKLKLSGKALLAQDYYEFVGVLNLFLKDLTSEDQLEPDDIIDAGRGSWKKEFYGDPFDYSDPVIRRRIVENYIGNSMPKLLLLLEGDTEEEAIPIIANSMGFYLKARGVEIYNYEGTGGIKGQNIRGTFDTAKKHSTLCYLISDNDERAQGYIEDLIRERLLEIDCYRIWESEFEEDNFGIDKVLDKINKALEENGLNKIEKNQVKDEMGRGKFLMKSLEDVFWKMYHYDLYLIISKRKLGILLGLERAQEIQEEIRKEIYEPKLEIEKILIEIAKKL